MLCAEPLTKVSLVDRNNRKIPFISTTLRFDMLSYSNEVFVKLDVDWEKFKEFCEEYEPAPSLDNVIRQWRQDA